MANAPSALAILQLVRTTKGKTTIARWECERCGYKFPPIKTKLGPGRA